MWAGRGDETSAYQVELWAGGNPSLFPASGFGTIESTVGATLIGGEPLTPTIAVGEAEWMSLILNTGAGFNPGDALWLRVESIASGGQAIWIDNVVVESVAVATPNPPVTTPDLGGYSGGNGTAEDPYQIATAEDLIALGDTPDDYDKHFVLTADIDLSNWIFSDALIAHGEVFSGDDADGTRFRGDFNGNGHVISNLTIDSVGSGSRSVGLFGLTRFGASIYDLGMRNCRIRSDGWYTGSIVGRNWGGGH